MDEDRRFGWPHIKEIVRLREREGWTQPRLASQAGVSSATIKRIEDHHNIDRRQKGVFRALGAAFRVDPRTLYFDSKEEALKALSGYTWKDIERGASLVAKQLLSDGKPKFDAVLTFPAASSIFCGLVLRALPLNVSLRLPVYTAFFGRFAVELGNRQENFVTVNCGVFTVFVPKAVLKEDLKKIVVIEDCIITGRAMDNIKGFFKRNPKLPEVEFACCICVDSRNRARWITPDIIGLELEQRDRFELPWGEAYSYEDVFEQESK